MYESLCLAMNNMLYNNIYTPQAYIIYPVTSDPSVGKPNKPRFIQSVEVIWSVGIYFSTTKYQNDFTQ